MMVARNEANVLGDSDTVGAAQPPPVQSMPGGHEHESLILLRFMCGSACAGPGRRAAASRALRSRAPGKRRRRINPTGAVEWAPKTAAFVKGQRSRPALLLVASGARIRPERHEGGRVAGINRPGPVALEERLQRPKLPSHLPAYSPSEGPVKYPGERLPRELAHLCKAHPILRLLEAILDVEDRGRILLAQDETVRPLGRQVLQLQLPWWPQ